MQQEVHLPGSQYVAAVQGVRRAVRLWHRMDAALVSFPPDRKDEAPWKAVWEALGVQSGALDDALSGLLGHSPEHERDR